MKNWSVRHWILLIFTVGVVFAMNVVILGIVFKSSQPPNEGQTQIRLAILGMMNTIIGFVGANLSNKNQKSDI